MSVFSLSSDERVHDAFDVNWLYTRFPALPNVKLSVPWPTIPLPITISWLPVGVPTSALCPITVLLIPVVTESAAA